MSDPVKRSLEDVNDPSMDEAVQEWFAYYLNCGHSEEEAWSMATSHQQDAVVEAKEVVQEVPAEKKSKQIDTMKLRESFATARNYEELESLCVEHASHIENDPSMVAKAIRRYAIVKCRHPDELPWAEVGAPLDTLIGPSNTPSLLPAWEDFLQKASSQADAARSPLETPPPCVDAPSAESKADDVGQEMKPRETRQKDAPALPCAALCDALWGLAKMHTNGLPSYQTLLRALANPGLEGRCSSVPLAEAAWAFGRGLEMAGGVTSTKADLKKLLTPEDVSALQWVGRELAERVDLAHLGAHQMVGLMRGFAIAGVTDLKMFAALAEEVVRQHKAFTEKDFTDIAATFSRFGVNLRNEIQNIKNPQAKKESTPQAELNKPKPLEK